MLSLNAFPVVALAIYLPGLNFFADAEDWGLIMSVSFFIVPG